MMQFRQIKENEDVKRLREYVKKHEKTAEGDIEPFNITIGLPPLMAECLLYIIENVEKVSGFPETIQSELSLLLIDDAISYGFHYPSYSEMKEKGMIADDWNGLK